MQLCLIVFLVSLTVIVNGFSTGSRILSNRALTRKTFTLSESKEPVEQTVQDLNLEQMFEVFDEADKKIKDDSTEAESISVSKAVEVAEVAEDGGAVQQVGELAGNFLTYGLYAYIAYLFIDSVRILVMGAGGPPPS